MKWSKRSPHSIVSGEWIIGRSRVTVNGETKDEFTLWRGTELVGRHDTAAAAKSAAKEKAQ